MNKEQKQEVIETLKNKFSQYSNFYITDTQHLSVAQITNLRRHCFDKQVEMKVAKNTLIKKALESLDNDKYSGVYDSLHQVTALMFSDSPKEPALIISSFRKSLNGEKPLLKAAFLNGDIFVGDNQLVSLTKIKTKNELIGEVTGLLMSPIQRVIGALQNRAETSEATEAVAQETQPVAGPTAETKAEAAKPTDIPQEAKPVTPAAAEAKEEATEPKAEVSEIKTEAEEPKAIAQEATPAAAEAKVEATEPKAEATETKVEEVAEPEAIAQETTPVTPAAAEAKTEAAEPKAEAGEPQPEA